MMSIFVSPVFIFCQLGADKLCGVIEIDVEGIIARFFWAERIGVKELPLLALV